MIKKVFKKLVFLVMKEIISYQQGFKDFVDRYFVKLFPSLQKLGLKIFVRFLEFEIFKLQYEIKQLEAQIDLKKVQLEEK